MRKLFASVTSAAVLKERADSPGALIATTLLLFPPVVMFTGWVIRDLWTWFLEPIWDRSITYGQSVGLVLFLAVLQISLRRLVETDRPTVKVRVAAAAARLIMIALAWGVGAVCHALLI